MRFRSLGLTLILAIATFGTSAATTTARTEAKADAERLVFLLQYVGTDYEVAVRAGRIIDEAEYRENREFTSLIVESFARLRPEVPSGKRAPLDQAIGELDRLVTALADPGLVRTQTENAIPLLVEAFALRAFPKERPDTQRAARLYAENCAPCHGSSGAGDGPRAKDLDPPPARFTDAKRMAEVPPYLFYNAITFGVGNTAMASFADSFSDQERWDLAFYLWTFVAPHDAVEAPVVFSLRELATRSSLELAPEAIRQMAKRESRIGDAQAAMWVARLRAAPPARSDAEERLARLRQDIARSVSRIGAADFDGAADLVTTAYLTEFEPLEPEIDRLDRRVRQRFERGLIDFRGALRRKDGDAALLVAGELERSVEGAAALLSPKRPDRRSPLTAAIVVGIAVVGAVVLVLVRIGKGRAVR